MTSADAPTLVDWLQGWGAAAGVLLSALAVLVTALSLRNEVRIRHRQEAEAEVAQARLVWGEVERISRAPGSDAAMAEVRVRNNSDGEICDASVVLTVRNSSATRRALDAPVRPKDFGTTKIPLAPTADAPSGDLDSIRRRLALPADSVTLRFIDSSGRRWVRKGMSEPRREPSGSPKGR